MAFSAREHKRWDKAARRLEADVTAQVRRLTPEEIAREYPGGEYPEEKLCQAHILSQGDLMPGKRSPEAIAKYQATMAAKKLLKVAKPTLTAVPKAQSPTVTKAVIVQEPKKKIEVSSFGRAFESAVECDEIADLKDAFKANTEHGPSPAIHELDSLIHDLERQLAETRGVKQLLLQRQGVA